MVNCCCCHYDPFDDDTPETRIKDLSFALRKLSAMKCQMRKWRLERLELESQLRVLTKILRANGVNVDTVLKVDPLVTHLRAEYQKLENLKAALEDEVRDLRETIKERQCFEDEPCKAVIYAREKMLELRARCATEKRRLRETMGNLQLKLEEASARLTNEVDQQQVSEKSIGELCSQLKKENKRLLVEVETLKKFQKLESPKTVDVTKLCERMHALECELTQMRHQLAERDAMIQDLEKRLQTQRRNSTQLEKVAVSQRALGDQNVAIKAKQKQQNEMPRCKPQA
ncbi:uncharacterized protein LOC131667400 [Phymastichus coffea]|uniref:uncharacterized protein LOC131667400 n=1 Tax=Phymastichus coffea TaxID=108790 RepID=UPI00273CA84A|nr:uncharacterized protein LOC131667400 [Phymastichus coffea]